MAKTGSSVWSEQAPPARSQRRRHATAALLGVVVCVCPPAAAFAQSTPPSVRLMAGSPKLTLTAGEFGAGATPGMFVASVGGDFELRASRPDYDKPLRLVQVDSAGGAVIRVLPRRLAAGPRGLRRFVRLTVRSSRGRVVRSRYVDFCPNGERERVSDAGPLLPRYPGACWSSFPFIRGMVWGIDEGWATSLSSMGGELEDESIDPGELLQITRGRLSTSTRDAGAPKAGRSRRYTVTARIAPVYRKLLAVREGHAQATVKLTVKAPARRRRTRGRTAAASPPARAAQVPVLTEPDPATLPDLVALPGYAMRLVNRRGRNVLRFSSTTWNAGPGQLVIEGFRRPGTATMDAYQYFLGPSRRAAAGADAKGEAVGRAPVGTLRYHGARSHQHWHLLQFAAYSLLDGSRRRVVRGRKQSFCLTPTDPVDLTLPHARWAGEGADLQSACGSPASIWVREALGVGWGDTYMAGLQGQAFDVTKLRNGRYHLRIQANPLASLREASLANNVSVRTIRLKGKGKRRRVIVAPWKGLRN